MASLKAEKTQGWAQSGYMKDIHLCFLDTRTMSYGFGINSRIVITQNLKIRWFPMSQGVEEYEYYYKKQIWYKDENDSVMSHF